MSTVVKPEDFSAAFASVVQARQPEIVAQWPHTKTYTGLMLNPTDGILKDVASNLGLVYRAAFMTVDAVLSDGGTPHTPAVLIEHENNASGLTTEARRLAVINASLKVLITYATQPLLQAKFLDWYLQELRAVGLPIGHHLIIFGRRNNDEVIWDYWGSVEQFERLSGSRSVS